MSNDLHVGGRYSTPDGLEFVVLEIHDDGSVWVESGPSADYVNAGWYRPTGEETSMSSIQDPSTRIELTTAGQAWAEANANDSMVANVALQGYDDTTWPEHFTTTAIEACNRAASPAGEETS